MKPRWLEKLDAWADWTQTKTWDVACEWLTGKPYQHRDWHSWIHHGLVAGVWTIPWALFGYQLWGAGIALVFYVWREGLSVRRQGHVTPDNCMDLVGPALIVALALIGG